MNVKMLKLGAIYCHVTRRSKIAKPHIIGGSVRVEAELSNGGADDTLQPDLRIKISDDFRVMGQTLIIYVLKLGILNKLGLAQIRLTLKNCALMRIVAIFRSPA